MQHRHRIISMFFVLLALSITFAACGDSNDSSSQTTSGRTQTAQTVTSATRARSTAKDRLIEVFPAIGAKHGVVVHQPSKPDWITWYNCAKGLKTVEVSFGRSIYNGTTISFDEHGSWLTDYGFMQENVILRFAGNVTAFAPKVVSLIVGSALQSDDNNDMLLEDDVVANLKPAMITGSGIKLNTSNFTAGNIFLVRLCIKR